ncbi:DUF4304 domain-containing protein [Micromonospora endolithica]|uniref:DUF4304 domain-containing protein n=1 Tax=Micromonospora endolithica TaxID=230091 RepID=A0A3A9Z6G8_9ACTN|nr:DUF4304 domain-containing protein [Micromonospora endolithica]
MSADLAGHGFTPGAGGQVFRRFSDEGDALVVEVQISDHSTTSEKVFYLNVALVLAPTWAWDRQRTGRPATALPRHVDGIWRRRLGSSGLSGDDQWRVADDNTAGEVSAQIRRHLDEIMPHLLPLLDRAVVLERPPGILGPGAWLLRAWLLAEQGPTEVLRHLLFVERPPATHNSVPTRTVWAYANRQTRATEQADAARAHDG